MQQINAVTQTKLDIFSNTRSRKYQLLLATAVEMFNQGAFPSITDLANQAEVSRATAYRYFPSQAALISSVVEQCLKPILSWQPKNQEAQLNVSELLDFAYPEMLKHEGALRAALKISLEQWAELRSHSIPQEERLVRGHRKQVLTQVTKQLKNQLTPSLLEKVIHGLSLIYGSEVFMVLKDIWQLETEQIQDVTKWVAKAILNQAQQDMLEQQEVE